MPAKDLGNKHVCFKCGAKFYDLKKPDPICPKCGSDQREAAAVKAPSEGRRGRLSAVAKVIEPEPEEAPEAAAAGEEEEDLDAFEEEEEVEAAEEEDI